MSKAVPVSSTMISSVSLKFCSLKYSTFISSSSELVQAPGLSTARFETALYATNFATGVRVGVGVALGVGETEAVWLEVELAVGVAEAEAEGDADGVELGDGVAVGVTDGGDDGDEEGVVVALADGLTSWVLARVPALLRVVSVIFTRVSYAPVVVGAHTSTW